MPSAEGKGKGLYFRHEKIDSEGAVLHSILLTNQLIQAVFGYGTKSRCIDVHTVICARRLPVQRDPKADRLSILRWSKNKMKVSGMLR